MVVLRRCSNRLHLRVRLPGSLRLLVTKPASGTHSNVRTSRQLLIPSQHAKTPVYPVFFFLLWGGGPAGRGGGRVRTNACNFPTPSAIWERLFPARGGGDRLRWGELSCSRNCIIYPTLPVLISLCSINPPRPGRGITPPSQQSN